MNIETAQLLKSMNAVLPAELVDKIADARADFQRVEDFKRHKYDARGSPRIATELRLITSNVLTGCGGEFSDRLSGWEEAVESYFWEIEEEKYVDECWLWENDEELDEPERPPIRGFEDLSPTDISHYERETGDLRPQLDDFQAVRCLSVYTVRCALEELAL